MLAPYRPSFFFSQNLRLTHRLAISLCLPPFRFLLCLSNSCAFAFYINFFYGFIYKQLNFFLCSIKQQAIGTWRKWNTELRPLNLGTRRVEVFNFRSHSFTLAVPIGYKPERERERERERQRQTEGAEKSSPVTGLEWPTGFQEVNP